MNLQYQDEVIAILIDGSSRQSISEIESTIQSLVSLKDEAKKRISVAISANAHLDKHSVSRLCWFVDNLKQSFFDMSLFIFYSNNSLQNDGDSFAAASVKQRPSKLIKCEAGFCFSDVEIEAINNMKQAMYINHFAKRAYCSSFEFANKNAMNFTSFEDMVEKSLARNCFVNGK